MRKGNILPIALMAFAIVAFLVMVDYSIGSGKWPWSSEEPIKNVVQNTNSKADKLNLNETIITETVDQFTNHENDGNSNTSPTADWKTYTNIVNGYTVKYPSTWTIDSSEKNTVAVVAPKGLVRECGECAIAKMTITPSTTSGSPFMIISDDSNIHTVLVGGVSAQQGDDNGMGTERETVVPYNGKFLNIGWPSDTTVNKTYDLILSSFAFTSPTADWKTYTNSIDRYLIKYPTNYTVTDYKAYVDIQKNGSLEQSALQSVTIGVGRAADQNINANLDLYTWAKNGFSKTAKIVAYHNNPKEIRLGNNTFIKTDGDQGSSGIPEYFIFHNGVLYELTTLHGATDGSENETIISTFTFTK